MPVTRCLRTLTLLLTLLAMGLMGCASRPYEGSAVSAAPFLQRSITQEDDSIRVTAAVPDRAETIALTGLDLYEQGIQPIWLKIENTASYRVRAAPWSIDRDYFSAIEVAYMNRKKFSKPGYADMERWFYQNSLPRHIPPGETRTGLVFTHLSPGTKGFNLDFFGNGKAHYFTFFVPIPGFTADYTSVDFKTLYPASEIRDMDENELRTVLEEELPCCATGPQGKSDGGAYNVILVGTPLAVRRSLLRGGWNETALGAPERERSKLHHFRNRRSDAIFYADREDGNERVELHLWLSPWKVAGEPVWVGMAYYTIFEQSFLETTTGTLRLDDDSFLSRFVKESVAADIDSAQRFLMQNFWYNQSLRKFGLVSGVGESTPDNPQATFGGIGYFSKGHRFVLFLSETAIGLDEGEIIYDKRKLISEGDANE